MASLNNFSNPENPFPTIWKCPVSRKVFFAFVFETDFLDSRKSFICIFLFLWLFVWLILSVFFSQSLTACLLLSLCFLFLSTSLYPSFTVCYSFIVSINYHLLLFPCYHLWLLIVCYFLYAFSFFISLSFSPFISLFISLSFCLSFKHSSRKELLFITSRKTVKIFPDWSSCYSENSLRRLFWISQNLNKTRSKTPFSIGSKNRVRWVGAIEDSRQEVMSTLHWMLDGHVFIIICNKKICLKKRPGMAIFINCVRYIHSVNLHQGKLTLF